MLQHEPQEESSSTPAAQVRVTSEELAAAINALEASKDEEARHLAGTVAIGQVVEELKLEATPEEIWAQVQKQRAAEAAAARKTAPQIFPPQISLPQLLPRPRPRRRGWVWALFGMGWAVYGIAHGNLVHGNLVPVQPSRIAPVQSGTTVEVTGDRGTVSYVVHGTDVGVSGDNNTVTLRGQCLRLNVSGDGNTVRVIGLVKHVSATGDYNKIHWTKEQPSQATTFENSGDGNEIGPDASPAGR